jgi:hypothetical protein
MRSKTLMTASTYKKSSSCSQGVHLEIQTPQMKRLDSWSPSLASCSLSSAGAGEKKKIRVKVQHTESFVSEVTS